MLQGTKYFISALILTAKFFIMLSFCWTLLFICILPQPNCLMTEQFLCLTLVALMTFIFMERGSTMCSLSDGVLGDLGDVCFASLLYEYLTMHENLKGKGISKGGYLLEQSQLELAKQCYVNCLTL